MFLKFNLNSIGTIKCELVGKDLDIYELLNQVQLREYNQIDIEDIRSGTDLHRFKLLH